MPYPLRRRKKDTKNGHENERHEQNERVTEVGLAVQNSVASFVSFWIVFVQPTDIGLVAVSVVGTSFGIVVVEEAGAVVLVVVLSVVVECW